MSTDVLSDERPGLFARVRGILFQPQSEWARIANEAPSPLISGYAAPLAGLGAIAGLATHVVYGGFSLDGELAWRGVLALLYIMFAVLGVTLAATLIGFLAKRFRAESDGGRAKQLAAYAATPVFIAAFGAIAPPVAGAVMLLGVVYAFMQIGMGASRLLRLPEPDNNAPRFALAFAAAFSALAAIAAMFIGPLMNSAREALTGAIESASPPPPAPVVAQRPAAELALERLAQSHGAHVLSDPARLAEQLPSSLPGGFTRQSIATSQGGNVSRADATYARDGAQLRIAIIQFADTVDPAGGAALFDVATDSQRDNGYARAQSIDGRFYAEDVTGDHTRYIVIGRGVAMIAEGRTTVDQARAAIETIDLQRLEAAFGR